MEYQRFNTLQELEQADAAWKRGEFLAERKVGFHKMRLYQLDGFYIEVTYHTHFNVILKVCSFKDTKHLEPYLVNINIDGLMN
jgi:hypothetical protein